jgi:hypothetical protein
MFPARELPKILMKIGTIFNCPPTGQELDLVVENIRQILAENVGFRIEGVPEIDPGPGGKFTAFLSMPGSPYDGDSAVSEP